MRNRFSGMGALITVLLPGLLAAVAAVDVSAKEKRTGRTGEEPGRLVARYAEALAGGKMSDWAALDLGCLALHAGPGVPPKSDRLCWDETMKAHRDLVADEPETGIFGAVGRGLGFGLLAETHRRADTWKDYPPGVFVSPVAVKETTPRIEVERVTPVPSLAIQEKGKDPVAVRGSVVRLRIRYPDPLTAPLALKPQEVWWASGGIRRYGPVRDLAAEFVVVSGLRKLGYARDTAVVNEALVDAPQIPATRYGLNPDIGRLSSRPGAPSTEPPFKGGLVLGSAHWWTRQDGAEQLRLGVERARHLPGRKERLGLLRRLLLLDPDDAGANALLGTELFEAFLADGLKKSGINAADDAVKQRLVELYWNIQAPTWRQELTAVSTGYEPAADALYGAIAAFEIVAKHGSAPQEIRRRLGALHRWNGEADAALAMHEELFRESPETDAPRRGAFLSEVAWDRVQWLAWNRRYDHPWLGQARLEAEQALEMVKAPLDKLVAAQALLILEALSPDRTSDSMRARVRLVKQWHDGIPLPLKVTGVWGYLVGNELVKALVPEGSQVTLPTPVRSAEVLDVSVHSNPPPQDLLRAWDFDGEPAGGLPRGLLVSSPAQGQKADWRIERDSEAPTGAQVLVHHAVCPKADCVNTLLTEEATFEHVDVTIRLRFDAGGEGRAGIAVSGEAGEAVYTATVNHDLTEIAIHRVEQGQVTRLGTAALKPKPDAWHLLRIQRENFAHVSRSRLALFFDGVQILAVSDEPIPQRGRVGLVTMGTATARFDGLHILKLVSNEPLSPAAAY
jgi:hypothetical protein